MKILSDVDWRRGCVVALTIGVICIVSACSTPMDDPMLGSVKIMAAQISAGAPDAAVTTEIKGLIVSKGLPLLRTEFQKLLDGYVTKGYITAWQEGKILDLYDKAAVAVEAAK